MAGPRLLSAWLTGLSLLAIPISQVKTFARYPGGSAARVLEPAASHACTERLSPGSCARREAPPRQLSVPAAPCSCVRFFPRRQRLDELIPSATPEELAAAIIECIDAGARLVNLSAALAQVPSAKGERALGQALDHAANRGVIVVAAAGNQGTVGSTAITRHPWVIAVIACDGRGRPLSESNLGNSIGRRGLSAPGEGITSLGTVGDAVPSGGTSVAAPFVTGAIALVWSEFPDAGAGQIRLAVTQAHAQRRPTVVPALLNAWAIHAAMREFRSM